MEDKIKCVTSEMGMIIPIHNISLINVFTKHIWSNADAEYANHGYKLSDEQYEALMKELEIIGDKS